jgi:hypothetical protein
VKPCWPSYAKLTLNPRSSKSSAINAEPHDHFDARDFLASLGHATSLNTQALTLSALIASVLTTQRQTTALPIQVNCEFSREKLRFYPVDWDRCVKDDLLRTLAVKVTQSPENCRYCDSVTEIYELGTCDGVEICKIKSQPKPGPA